MLTIIATLNTTDERNDFAMLASAIGQEPVVLTYRDCDGVVSTRKVTCKNREKCLSGNYIYRCWDHNRNAPRSFRTERVVHVGTVETPADEPRTGHDNLTRTFRGIN